MNRVYLRAIFLTIVCVQCYGFYSSLIKCNQPLYRLWGGYRDFSGMNANQDEKIVNFQAREVEDLQLILEEHQSENYKSGAELRKSRNRDLKGVKRDQPPTADLGNDQYKTFKRSPEEIEVIILCLNLSYGNKSREQLTMEERVGLIDWVKFDQHAVVHICSESDYTKTFNPHTSADSDIISSTFRSKLHNWIDYHRKKGDIIFNSDTWVWKGHENNNKERRRKSNVRKWRK